MVVETENTITKKEFRRIMMKTFYQKPTSKILLCIGILATILVCTGVLSLNSSDKIQNYGLLFLMVLNLFMPFYLVWYADQQYNTSTILKGSFRFVFDEEKIYFQGDGIEGNYDWNKIIKYGERSIFCFYTSQHSK